LNRQTGQGSDLQTGPGNQVRRSQGQRARDSATTSDCARRQRRDLREGFQRFKRVTRRSETSVELPGLIHTARTCGALNYEAGEKAKNLREVGASTEESRFPQTSKLRRSCVQLRLFAKAMEVGVASERGSGPALKRVGSCRRNCHTFYMCVGWVHLAQRAARSSGSLAEVSGPKWEFESSWLRRVEAPSCGRRRLQRDKTSGEDRPAAWGNLRR
jgi:hypothetical protein